MLGSGGPALPPHRPGQLFTVQVPLWPEVLESQQPQVGRRADLLSGCFWFADHQWLLREETWLPQQDHVAEKELEAPVPSDSWCQTDPETQPFPRVRSQKRLVHPQLLRKHALRVAEQKVKWRRASFQLERIVKRQRLLEAHRRPEQLRALCWLQDDHPRRPLFQAPNPGALVSGPQCRSTWTRCSSLSLRRPCGQHSAQLRRYSQQARREALAEVYSLVIWALIFTSQDLSFLGL